MHFIVKREVGLGSIRVDLGQNGMEAKMERLPKEVMVEEEVFEEEVMMVLDSLSWSLNFKHQSLT